MAISTDTLITKIQQVGVNQYLGDMRKMADSTAALSKEQKAQADAQLSQYDKLITSSVRYTAAFTAMVGVLTGMSKIAMRNQEINDEFNLSLGRSAAAASKWADSFAKTNRLDPNNVREYTAELVLMSKAIGFNERAATKMSEQLVKRAYDVASMQHKPVEDVIKAFESGLTGKTRGLKSFAIDITQNTLDMAKYRQGVAALDTELTDLQKAQVINNIIMDQSSVAAGNYNDTLGFASKQMESFKNLMREAGGDMAIGFLAPIGAVVGAVNGLLELFIALPQPVKTAVGFVLALGTAWLGYKAIQTALMAKQVLQNGLLLTENALVATNTTLLNENTTAKLANSNIGGLGGVGSGAGNLIGNGVGQGLGQGLGNKLGNRIEQNEERSIGNELLSGAEFTAGGGILYKGQQWVRGQLAGVGRAIKSSFQTRAAATLNRKWDIFNQVFKPDLKRHGMSEEHINTYFKSWSKTANIPTDKELYGGFWDRMQSRQTVNPLIKEAQGLRSKAMLGNSSISPKYINQLYKEFERVPDTNGFAYKTLKAMGEDPTARFFSGAQRATQWAKSTTGRMAGSEAGQFFKEVPGRTWGGFKDIPKSTWESIKALHPKNIANSFKTAGSGIKAIGKTFLADGMKAGFKQIGSGLIKEATSSTFAPWLIADASDFVLGNTVGRLQKNGAGARLGGIGKEAGWLPNVSPTAIIDQMWDTYGFGVNIGGYQLLQKSGRQLRNDSAKSVADYQDWADRSHRITYGSVAKKIGGDLYKNWGEGNMDEDQKAQLKEAYDKALGTKFGTHAIQTKYDGEVGAPSNGLLSKTNNANDWLSYYKKSPFQTANDKKMADKYDKMYVENLTKVNDILRAHASSILKTDGATKDYYDALEAASKGTIELLDHQRQNAFNNMVKSPVSDYQSGKGSVFNTLIENASSLGIDKYNKALLTDRYADQLSSNAYALVNKSRGMLNKDGSVKEGMGAERLKMLNEALGNFLELKSLNGQNDWKERIGKAYAIGGAQLGELGIKPMGLAAKGGYAGWGDMGNNMNIKVDLTGIKSLEDMITKIVETTSSATMVKIQQNAAKNAGVR